jgi:hypothetical protein
MMLTYFNQQCRQADRQRAFLHGSP